MAETDPQGSRPSSSFRQRLRHGGRLFAIGAGLGGVLIIIGAIGVWRYEKPVGAALALALGCVAILGAVGFVGLGGERARLISGAATTLVGIAAMLFPNLPNLGPPGRPKGALYVIPWGGAICLIFGLMAILRRSSDLKAVPEGPAPAEVLAFPEDKSTPPTPDTPRRVSDASLLGSTIVAAVVIFVVLALLGTLAVFCSFSGTSPQTPP